MPLAAPVTTATLPFNAFIRELPGKLELSL
jgi:hypothetical protein